jgi:ATP-dependent DNA helicase RecQ
VLHTGVPKSIEHYQQESGAPAATGWKRSASLLYSAADAIVWRTMLERGGEGVEPDPAWVESAMRHVRDLDRYCSAASCRHSALVEYFGQQYTAENCHGCDICLGETESVPDATDTANARRTASAAGGGVRAVTSERPARRRYGEGSRSRPHLCRRSDC